MRSERCRPLSIAAILSTVALSCGRAPNTLAPRPDRVDVVPTTRVANGDLAGVVVDAASSLLVKDARIVARTTTPDGGADSTVTRSDPRGLFTLHLPVAENGSAVTVTVMAFGWLPESLPHLSLSSLVGHAAVLTLNHRAPRSPPRPSIFRTIPPEPSDTVPPGSLSGTVIEDSAGRGLASATVLLSDADPEATPVRRGPVARTVTDSLGRFHVRSVDARDAALTVQIIGYRTVSLRYAPQREQGSATIIALHAQQPVICALPVTPPPQVYVRVIDALTGKGPPAGATIVISTAGRLEAMHGDPTGKDSIVLLKVGDMTLSDSTTPTDIMIQTAGYGMWRKLHVMPPPSVCGSWGSVFLIAWLLPADPISR